MGNKIRKNLTDQDMLVNWHEQETFENRVQPDMTEVHQPIKKPTKTSLAADFLTPELTEKVGQALLDLKLKLYKEGIVDYKIKVSCEGKEILLIPVPVKKKFAQN